MGNNIWKLAQIHGCECDLYAKIYGSYLCSSKTREMITAAVFVLGSHMNGSVNYLVSDLIFNYPLVLMLTVRTAIAPLPPHDKGSKTLFLC